MVALAPSLQLAFDFNSLSTQDSMFNFFHPRPVVDGRAVAVKIVQQKASAQLDTRTLTVTATRKADSTKPCAPDGDSGS